MSWWLAENTSNKHGLSFTEFGVEKIPQDQVIIHSIIVVFGIDAIVFVLFTLLRVIKQ